MKQKLLFAFGFLTMSLVSCGAANSNKSVLTSSSGSQAEDWNTAVFSQTGKTTQDGVSYTLLTSRGGTLKKAIATDFDNKTFELKIPEKVNSVFVVKEIADNAFYQDPIVSATLPTTITLIGRQAFRGCAHLTKIDLTGVLRIGVGAFEDCNVLNFVTLSSSLTSIGAGAFMNCVALGQILIPDSVKEMEKSVFCQCAQLETIALPKALAEIPDTCFAECTNLASVTIPDSVTKIGSGVFQKCYKLVSCQIPSSVTEIGSYCFNECTSLTTCNIGNWKMIPERLFYDCEKLTNVTIPSTVVYIEGAAFYGCKSLTSIDIPASVNTLYKEAFFGCKGLTTVTLHEGLTAIYDAAFGEYTSSQAGYDASTEFHITEILIPQSVTTIGKWSVVATTIKCKAASKPAGWNSSWYASKNPVVWAA